MLKETGHPIIEIKHLQKRIEQNTILKDINLTVEPGKLTALIGPSGAGKSTLLHIIGTLDEATSGEVWIKGQHVQKLTPSALNKLRNETLGFVFQFHHLLPEFSAIENVAMPLWIRGQNKKEALKRAAEALALVGLADKAQHKPNQMSGGEQQRAAIARAIVTEPDIILADEPTGNLDSANAQLIFELLKKINRERHLTMVMVTHNEQLAEACDCIIKVQDGELIL
jgi:lipoprotein-releasing system ATP-binding protein